MAKIPRVIKWGFDPDTSALEALRNAQDRVIWAVLRFGHIVDQNFNDQVAALTANLRARPPVNVHDLFHRAWDFGLHGFGADPSNAPFKADEEWWGELLQAWRGELTIQHELPGAGRPSRVMSRANNDALDLLFRFWRWEADWMVCQGCKRPLIASRDGEEHRHEAGCENTDLLHPWADLRQALGSEAEASELHARLTAFRHDREQDLLGRARALVIQHRRASVSLVQRRLAVGWSYAEHLMCLLEKEGVVGQRPHRGARAFTFKPENARATNPNNPQT